MKTQVNVRYLVWLFAVFMMSGCSTATPTLAIPPAEDTSSMPETLSCDARPESEVRFLALGDSYTIGESVDEGERWPVQLAELLREAGVSIAAPEIIARTGWTTDELAAAIEAADPQGPYELVSLLIGVNNQYRGRAVGEYADQFSGLLDTAVAFAGDDPSRVIVVSIPDWGVTPFGKQSGRTTIGTEIDEFNATAKEITEARGAAFIDITPYSRTATDDLTLIAGDGLHPSGKMYSEWARMAFESACRALADS